MTWFLMFLHGADATMKTPTDTVRQTLVARGCAVDQTDRHGHTALHWAAYMGKLITVREPPRSARSGARVYLCVRERARARASCLPQAPDPASGPPTRPALENHLPAPASGFRIGKGGGSGGVGGGGSP